MMFVELEDAKELEKWEMGLTRIMEGCVFCGIPTRYWHSASNNPVCQRCADLHDESELPNRNNP
jgi:hypothetical protein